MRSPSLGVLLSMLLVSVAILAPGCLMKNSATIKIGAIYPLTGPSASAGLDVKNGILLAADIVNNEYNLNLPLARTKGIPSLGGAKIKIIFEDSQGSPILGRFQAQRLIDEEKVVTIIGCYQSAVTAEASGVAKDKGIPFLTFSSTAPSLTQRGFKWFFSTTPNEETFVHNFFLFLQDVQEKTGKTIDKLALIHENSVWGMEIAELEKRYAREHGYSIALDISYSADTENVTNEVQRLKDVNPDVVLQASYSNDAVLFMKNYKALDFNPSAILADNAGFIDPGFTQSLGKDSNYILTRMTWCRDLAESQPLIQKVSQVFQERYGTEMNDNSARAFTGILVLAEAINTAGLTDPNAIRKALLKTDLPSDKLIMPWDGVRFDTKTHLNLLGRGIICQIIGQEYYTVWPWNMATRELIWPVPDWAVRR
ncbi:ABC transporter substrate-binding protein [Chloroflexota bacterium]